MEDKDLEVVGVVLSEINFDGNPTIDSRDPDAYTKYAQRLDKWNPLWIWTDLDDMIPPLRDEAIVRRTEPVFQSTVRQCVRCDKDLEQVMGCYVFYKRAEGGIGVAPNSVIICVECRTELGTQTMNAKQYWDMLSSCGRRRWAVKVAADHKRLHG